MRSLIMILAVFAVTPGASGSPVGEWVVHDKSARVAIRACGPNLCGNISWTPDGKLIGSPVLLSMRPDGARWTGTVIDVRDGAKYLAHLALPSAGLLKLDGCVLGGLICKGEIWTRYK